MRLDKLTLNNFRNYSSTSITFNADIICIVGENGAGKTNIIDAIYYALLTKSSLNTVDSQNIREGEEYFFIKCSIDNHNKKSILILAFEKGKKKILKVNDSEVEKLSQHIGNYPVVLIAPDDVVILLGGSEERRKFFDGTLSQVDNKYLQNLINYHRYLKQRNSALKAFAETGRTDHTLLELYDENLLKYGKLIYIERARHLDNFLVDFNNNYADLSDDKEQVSIFYKSDFNDEKLDPKGYRQKDVILQRTTWGIHKDEYEFIINGKPVKKFASQGQRKSFLIALKLAQFDFITGIKRFKPILLLDDIFDKLDDKRMIKLLSMIKNNRFGQTFFTDPRVEYTKSLFVEKNIKFQLLQVSNGDIMNKDY